MCTFREAQISRQMAGSRQAPLSPPRERNGALDGASAAGGRAALLAISALVVVAAAGCAQQHPPPVPIVSSTGAEETVGAARRCSETDAGTSVLDAASSSGHLAPEKIRDVMRRHEASVSDCFEAGLERHAGFSGKVTLLFAIERDGRVSHTSVVQSDVADCEVTRCLRARFEQLSFPPPEGGAVLIQYPISIEAQALPAAVTVSRR